MDFTQSWTMERIRCFCDLRPQVIAFEPGGRFSKASFLSIKQRRIASENQIHGAWEES